MTEYQQTVNSYDDWTTVSNTKSGKSTKSKRHMNLSYDDLFNEYTTSEKFKDVLNKLFTTYTDDQVWNLLMKLTKVNIGDSNKYKQWIYCTCSYSRCKKIHFKENGKQLSKKKAYIMFEELIKYDLFPWKRFLCELIKLYIKFNKVIISMYKVITVEDSGEKFNKNKFLTEFNMSDLTEIELNKILEEISTDKKVYNIEWKKIRMLIQLYTNIANLSRSYKYQQYRWPDIYLYHKNGIIDDMMYHWAIKLYDGFYCNKDRINHLNKLFDSSNNKIFCSGSHNCSFGVHINSVVLDISNKFRNPNKIPDSLNIPKTHWINTISKEEKMKIYRDINNKHVTSQYFNELLNLISTYNVKNLYVIHSDDKIKKYSDILEQIEIQKLEEEKILKQEQERVQSLIQENLKIDKKHRRQTIEKQKQRISKSKEMCESEKKRIEELKTQDSIIESRKWEAIEESIRLNPEVQIQERNNLSFGESKKDVKRRLKKERQEAEKLEAERQKAMSTEQISETKTKDQIKSNHSKQKKSKANSSTKGEFDDSELFGIDYEIFTQRIRGKVWVLFSPFDGGFKDNKISKYVSSVMKKEFGCNFVIKYLENGYSIGWSSKNINNIIENIIDFLINTKYVYNKDQIIIRKCQHSDQIQSYLDKVIGKIKLNEDPESESESESDSDSEDEDGSNKTSSWLNFIKNVDSDSESDTDFDDD